MSHKLNSPDPEFQAIEFALGSLVVAASQIDRDQVMFAAGRASVRPSPATWRGWSAIAASLALITVGETTLLALRPPPRVIERVVVLHEPTPMTVDSSVGSAVSQAPSPTEGLFSLGQTARDRLASQVLRYGLDGLPASPATTWSDSRRLPASSGQLLQEELRRILDPGDHS